MLRARRRLAAIVITAAALAPLATLASIATAPVALGADGLQFRTAARYVLMPERGVVRVGIDVTLTNLQPDSVSGNIRTRYYYDRIALAVQDESSHLAAVDGGRRLTVTKSEQKGFDLVTVRLASNLYYRQTQTFRITYDLPGGKPRSDSDIRVGRAFASFYAWSSGDRGTVRIEIPAGFDVSTYGDDVQTTKAGGRTILSATVDQTSRWSVGVYADDPKALAARDLDLPNRESIVVRSWPEDRAWADHVSKLLTTALPTLEQLLGLPWPVTDELQVSEVHTPTLEGYAGIYDSTNDEIVITEDLDDHVIVHEAAHAWFNKRLFDDRWANEGLADLYASLALEDGGQAREHAPAVSRTSKASFALLDWGPPQRIDDRQTDAREDYGYDASWQLLERLHDEIGDDGMRAVIRAAEAETIPYVGAGEPEPLPGHADWRRFLDLLEGVGGSKQATDLFTTWVVDPTEIPALQARGSAREAYAALVGEGEGWLPPLLVRTPMATWDWAAARKEMADARAVLALRDQLAAEASAAGLTAPSGLEALYEGATQSFDDATGLAARQLDALHALAAASAVLAAPRDQFTQWGLDGVTQPETQLAAADAAWTAGDLDAATTGAAAAQATLAAAPEAGRTKAMTLGGAGAAGVVLLVGGTAVVVVRRRRGHLAAVQPPAATLRPFDDAPTEPLPQPPSDMP
jgi:hypothetical protein